MNEDRIETVELAVTRALHRLTEIPLTEQVNEIEIWRFTGGNLAGTWAWSISISRQESSCPQYNLHGDRPDDRERLGARLMRALLESRNDVRRISTNGHSFGTVHDSDTEKE